jgi:hypothetical protein
MGPTAAELEQAEGDGPATGRHCPVVNLSQHPSLLSRGDGVRVPTAVLLTGLSPTFTFSLLSAIASLFLKEMVASLSGSVMQELDEASLGGTKRCISSKS